MLSSSYFLTNYIFCGTEKKSKIVLTEIKDFCCVISDYFDFVTYF